MPATEVELLRKKLHAVKTLLWLTIFNNPDHTVTLSHEALDTLDVNTADLEITTDTEGNYVYRAIEPVAKLSISSLH
jgi:hypothetical protein